MEKPRSEESVISELLAYAALKILLDKDGTMLLSELLTELEKQEGDKIAKLEGHYDDGRIKWKVRMQSASNMFIKSGYLQKDRGTWHLTPEGEKALSSTEKDELIDDARKRLNEWNREKRLQAGEGVDASDEDGESNDTSATDDEADDAKNKIESYQSEAKMDIKKYIQSLSGHEFQSLCAALLRGMGYYIRYDAPPGPDGGVDIIAYIDPLGGTPPRIYVQVKNWTSNVPANVLKELADSLRKEGDIGVLITSSYFTRDCKRKALDHPKHVELIDFDRFVNLWIEHYDKLSKGDKSLLPLRAINFLASGNG